MRIKSRRWTKWLVGIVVVYILGVLSNLIAARSYTSQPRNGAVIDHVEHSVAIPFVLITNYSGHDPEIPSVGGGHCSIAISFFGFTLDLLTFDTWVS
jgi:hypothetical protein